MDESYIINARSQPFQALSTEPQNRNGIRNKGPITEDQEEPTIASALAAAPRFGLKASEAKEILRAVFTAVSDWRKTGRQLRLKASTLDTYDSAFENSLMEETRSLIANK